MLEILWIVTPAVLLVATCGFVAVYWKPFWFNRTDHIAQNLMALAVILGAYALAIFIFRICEYEAQEFMKGYPFEHTLRVVVDLATAAVILWRTLQVYAVMHELSE